MTDDTETTAPVPARPWGRTTLRENVVVVLNETQDVVNIAGTVRAMMNTGLRRLRLVRPVEFDPRRIDGIAHGAAAVLERTEFYDTLTDAIADAVHVAGTTARRRTAAYVWRHPREAAADLLRLAASGAGPVALVFGREDAGLSNEELDLCDSLLNVPTDEEFPSLNLAQAVLLVTYELWLEAGAAGRPLPRPRRHAPPAGTEALRLLFEDVEKTLHAIEFFKKRNPAAIMRTLRAAARRAELDEREAKLLRAIAIETRRFMERTGRGAAPPPAPPS